VRGCALTLCLFLGTGLNVDSICEERRREGLRDLLPDTPLDESVGIFELAPLLEIGRIMPGEVLGGGSGRSISMGTWSRHGTATASFEIETQFVRSMPGIWCMRVRDFESTHTTTARYLLTSPDGSSDGLANIEDPSSVIRARISPIPPRVIDGDLEFLTLEGGLVLHLDLQGVRTSGVHVGTLTVTLENY
jgi:hypothetical protein